MFSKRSKCKCKCKSKCNCHFRRRSTRHRRRTHNRKGGGKAELEAELKALTEQWRKLTAHGAQVPYHVAQEFGQKRTELLAQLDALKPKVVRELEAAAAAASHSATVKAFQTDADKSKAFIANQEKDVMSRFVLDDKGWRPKK